jgi:predicted nuclease with TOPRIM domain
VETLKKINQKWTKLNEQRERVETLKNINKKWTKLNEQRERVETLKKIKQKVDKIYILLHVIVIYIFQHCSLISTCLELRRHVADQMVEIDQTYKTL